MIIPFDTLSSYIADWATFLATLTALLTLREMYRQRLHSYKPDIVPVEQIFNAYFHSPLLCDWREIDYKQEQTDEDTISDYQISLFNLGNGAAKSIKITWSFDIDAFIENVNNINKENDSGIEINNTDFILEFKEKETIKYAVNLQPSLKDRRDYLLPASIEKTPLKIPLPRAYILLYSNCLYNKYILNRTLDFTVPKLKLTIEFSDIANNKYNTIFLFNIGLIFSSYKKCENMPDLRGYIQHEVFK